MKRIIRNLYKKYDGRKYSAEIEGYQISGKIRIVYFDDITDHAYGDIRAFLCHNEPNADGGGPNDGNRYGYRYSWVVGGLEGFLELLETGEYVNEGIFDFETKYKRRIKYEECR